MASDPFYIRDTLISAVPCVCELLTRFLPTSVLDIVIYFRISVSVTIYTMYGMYNLPWYSLSKKTTKLRITIESKLSEFNFRTRKKKKKVKAQVQNYRRRRCRRYISIKRKGKQQRIGNKSKVRYKFIRVQSTTYEVSSTATSTGSDKYNPKKPKYKFDSDSYMIGIDNHSSRCISNGINHFITALTPTSRSYLRGITGNLQAKGEYKLVWSIDDDHGVSHKIKIKNCLYVPGLPSCLASPQHWADQADDNYPSPGRI